MALGLAHDLAQHPESRVVATRALASLVQAILHGLAMQRAADPNAFNRQEMLDLCLDVLGTYLWGESGTRKKRKRATNKTTTTASPARARRLAHPSHSKGVNGERTK
jgi:hypothetical protein